MTKLGILTGGGDAPGLNPAIKWVVKHSIDSKVADEILGIPNGWKGFLNGSSELMPLDEQIVRTWDRDGGTNLGSSRTNPFDVNGEDKSEEVLSNIKKLGLDYVIAMGGEDTLSVAAKLQQISNKEGIDTSFIGIPKTVDKDLRGTAYTLGFYTALEDNRLLINKLRNPAGSHGMIYIVEIMGRHAGHLALYSGMAGAAAVILIPEYPFELRQVAQRLAERRKNGARYDIVVVAEGAKIKGGSEITKDAKKDSFGHMALGGIGVYLAQKIEELTGYETRDNKPGHAQRGPPPHSYDVLMGRLFGIGAIELIKAGKSGYMVSLKSGRVSMTSLEEVTKGLNLVNVKRQYDTQRLNAKRRAIGFQLF